MATYTIADGTPVVFADTTDFDNTDFTRTHQIDLSSLATTKARQSAKADLGATRANRYAVKVSVAMAVAAANGTTIEYYWSASPSGTAATANDGGASGADEAYHDGKETEYAGQLLLLGMLPLSNDAGTGVQKMTIGIFTPPQRYGSVVVVNKTAQALVADVADVYVALIPITEAIA